jgi:hypothetical protein
LIIAGHRSAKRLLFELPRRIAIHMEETILVTGGSGFIGSNFILRWYQHESTPVVNLDNLTYAGNPRNLSRVCSDPSRLLKNYS